MGESVRCPAAVRNSCSTAAEYGRGVESDWRCVVRVGLATTVLEAVTDIF